MAPDGVGSDGLEFLGKFGSHDEITAFNFLARVRAVILVPNVDMLRPEVGNTWEFLVVSRHRLDQGAKVWPRYTKDKGPVLLRVQI